MFIRVVPNFGMGFGELFSKSVHIKKKEKEKKNSRGIICYYKPIYI